MNYLSRIKVRGAARNVLTEGMAVEIISRQGLDYSYEVDAVTKLTNGSILVAYQTVNQKSQLHSNSPIPPTTRVACFTADGRPTFNMIAG